MHDDFCRADDVHVHLHPHLEEEELGIRLQTVDFQDIRVIGVVHAHPKVGVHTRGEFAQHHRMFGNADDGDDALALETVLVHLGILRVLDLLVGNVLVIRVPSIPSDDEGQRGLLADLFRALFPHGVKGRLDRRSVRQFGRSRDDALPAGDGLGIRGVHVVEDALDDPVEILLTVGADLRAAGGFRDLGRRLAAFCRWTG